MVTLTQDRMVMDQSFTKKMSRVTLDPVTETYPDSFKKVYLQATLNLSNISFILKKTNHQMNVVHTDLYAL